MITSVQITSVVAVGLVEGTTHVNWPKVGQILKWWILTIIPIFLATAVLFGQGMSDLWHAVVPGNPLFHACLESP